MNYLNEDQVNLIKASSKWYWRLMLTPWRFLIVPLMMVWSASMMALSILVLPFVVVSASILVAASCVITGAPRIYWKIVGKRASELSLIWKLWDKLLVGENKSLR